MRIIAPLQPVESSYEIAERVIEAVKASTGLSEEAEALQARPLARIYVDSHKKRRMAGHKTARLYADMSSTTFSHIADSTFRMQEPGTALLFHPDLIKDEIDVQFETEGEGDVTAIFLKRLKPEEVDQNEVNTLITKLDMEKFWDTLVRVRAIDWSTHLKEQSRHDEL